MTPLEQAYKLIEKPQSWCQNITRTWQTENGKVLKDKLAYCSIGALAEFNGLDFHPTFNAHLVRAQRGVMPRYSPDLVTYNDNHSHAQVTRLWRLVIATEKAGGFQKRDQARRRRQIIIALRKIAHAHKNMVPA